MRGGLRISKPPRHGQAGVAGLSGVAYKAPVNFVGSDNFEMVILGHDQGETADVVTYKVDVVP